MTVRSESQNLGCSWQFGRILPAAITSFALMLGTSTAVIADDSDEASPFGDAAIDDYALSQTVGVAQGALTVIQNANPDGEGSVQAVSIGSYNNGRGFGSYNAVAVAVIEQDAVQIVGTDLTEAITAD